MHNGMIHITYIADATLLDLRVSDIQVHDIVI